MEDKKNLNTPEKNRVVNRETSLTPRAQSKDSLKFQKKSHRSKSKQASISKYTKSEKKLKDDLNQLKQLIEPPILYSESKQPFKDIPEKKIKVFIANFPGTVKKKHKLNKIKSAKRSKEVTPKSEMVFLKDIIERTTPKLAKNEGKIVNFGIVEKTDMEIKRKTQKLAMAETEKMEREMKECTFQPNLSAKGTPRAFHKKSKSQTILSVKVKKKKVEELSGNSQSYAKAHGVVHKKSPMSLYDKGTFVSCTLGKMSPGKRMDDAEITEKLKRFSMPSKL